MNIETKPNAQMPPGKARKVKAGDDDPKFEDGVFMYGIIPRYPFGTGCYRNLPLPGLGRRNPDNKKRMASIHFTILRFN
jgi:hypothetical protein